MDEVRQRAESGSAQAQFEYANELKKLGREEEAVQWYEKAGRQGRADAMYEAGNYYNNNCRKREAFKWYKEASAEEYAAAMYELGNFYMLDGDCFKAVELYLKAATKGLADALAMLTTLHNKLEEERNGNISLFHACVSVDIMAPLACTVTGAVAPFVYAVAGAVATSPLANFLRRRSRANECQDSDINRALGNLNKEERNKLYAQIDNYFKSDANLI